MGRRLSEILLTFPEFKGADKDFLKSNLTSVLNSGDSTRIAKMTTRLKTTPEFKDFSDDDIIQDVSTIIGVPAVPVQKPVSGLDFGVDLKGKPAPTPKAPAPINAETYFKDSQVTPKGSAAVPPPLPKAKPNLSPRFSGIVNALAMVKGTAAEPSSTATQKPAEFLKDQETIKEEQQYQEGRRRNLMSPSMRASDIELTYLKQEADRNRSGAETAQTELDSILKKGKTENGKTVLDPADYKKAKELQSALDFHVRKYDETNKSMEKEAANLTAAERAQKESQGFFEKRVKSGASAVTGIAKSIGDAMRAAGIEQTGKAVSRWVERFEDNSLHVYDPKFIDMLANGVVSTGVFFIPGFGSVKVAQALGAAPKIAALFGRTASAAIESMSEAGNVYSSLIAKGVSPDQARGKALNTFLINLPLNAVTDKWLFADVEGAGKLRKIFTATEQEAAQEGTQSLVSQTQEGNSLAKAETWKQAALEALVGGIVGGGMTGARMAPGVIANKVLGKKGTPDRTIQIDGKKYNITDQMKDGKPVLEEVTSPVSLDGGEANGAPNRPLTADELADERMVRDMPEPDYEPSQDEIDRQELDLGGLGDEENPTSPTADAAPPLPKGEGKPNTGNETGKKWIDTLKPEEVDNTTEIAGRNAIRREVDLAKSQNKQVLTFDIDDFKAVNDQYGHDTGDDVLKAIGRLAKEHFGGKAKVGRSGGEEFSIVPESEITKEDAVNFINAISSKISVDGSPVTVSAGMAYGELADEKGKKHLHADLLAYKAKEGGKNALVIIDKEGKEEYIKGKETGEKKYVHQADLRTVQERARRLLGNAKNLTPDQRDALERTLQAFQQEEPGASEREAAPLDGFSTVRQSPEPAQPNPDTQGAQAGSRTGTAGATGSATTTDPAAAAPTKEVTPATSASSKPTVGETLARPGSDDITITEIRQDKENHFTIIGKKANGARVEIRPEVADRLMGRERAKPQPRTGRTRSVWDLAKKTGIKTGALGERIGDLDKKTVWKQWPFMFKKSGKSLTDLWQSIDESDRQELGIDSPDKLGDLLADPEKAKKTFLGQAGISTKKVDRSGETEDQRMEREAMEVRASENVTIPAAGLKVGDQLRLRDDSGKVDDYKVIKKDAENITLEDGVIVKRDVDKPIGHVAPDPKTGGVVKRGNVNLYEDDLAGQSGESAPTFSREADNGRSEDQTNPGMVEGRDSQAGSPKGSATGENGPADSRGTESGRGLHFPAGSMRQRPFQHLGGLSRQEKETRLRSLENDLARQTGKPVKPGKLFNPFTRRKKFVQKLAEIITGNPVIWYVSKDNAMEAINGSSFNGAIFLNYNSTVTALSVALHEAVHRMRVNHPDLYQDLFESLQQTANSDYKAEFRDWFIRNFYKSNRIQGAIAWKALERKDRQSEELITQFSGQQAHSAAFWSKIYDRAPESVKRLLEILEDLINNLRGAVKIKGKEVETVDSIFRDVEGMRDAIVEAITEMSWRESERRGDTTAEGGAAFSRKSDQEDAAYFDAMKNQQDMFDGTTAEDKRAPAERAWDAVRGQRDERVKAKDKGTEDLPLFEQNREPEAEQMALFSRRPDAEIIREDEKSLNATYNNFQDNPDLNGNSITVVRIPGILKHFGLSDNPVKIRRDNFHKILFGNISHQPLTKEQVGLLPSRITNPIAVYKSDTVPGAVVFVTDLQDNGKLVIGAIHPNQREGHHTVHFLASAYLKDRKEWYTEQKKNLLYVNKKKVLALAQSAGLQLPLEAFQHENLKGSARSESAGLQLPGDQTPKNLKSNIMPKDDLVNRDKEKDEDATFSRKPDSDSFSFEVDRLHEHPARRKGFKDAFDKEIRLYLSDLIEASTDPKMMQGGDTFLSEKANKLAKNAERLYYNGDIEGAIAESEKALGYIHERATLQRGPDYFRNKLGGDDATFSRKPVEIDETQLDLFNSVTETPEAETIESEESATKEPDKTDTEPTDLFGNLTSNITLPAAEKGEIQDFGKKIGGAKKDLWKERGLLKSDLDGMTPQEIESHAIKANVWPGIDYAKLVEDGMPKGLAFLVKKVKDSIAIKPEFSRKEIESADLREAAIKRYVETVSKIKEMVLKVESVADIHKLSEELFPRESSGYGHRYTTAANADLLLIGGRAVSSALQPSLHALAIATRKVEETGFPGKQEGWQRRFEIHVTPAGTHVMRNGKDEALKTDGYFVTAKNSRRILADFDNRELAEAWAKDQAKGSTGERLVRPYNPDVRRKGEDYRKGKDVTGQDILDTFGFRGGEFGNWTNQADRQQSLNQAYDAFKDLATILGVPDKALSLNGELGIAFGARGSGKFAAHYEEGRVVINLTKTNGAGALAHEWAHAVDDYFGRIATKGRPGQFLSHGTQGSVRPEVLTAWGKVMTAISDRIATKEKTIETRKSRVTKMRSYLDSWLKPIETNQAEKPNDEAAEIIAMLRDEKPKMMSGKKASPQELASVLSYTMKKAGFPIDTERRNAIGNNAWHLEAANVALAKAEAGQDALQEKTDFLRQAEGKTGEYWGRKHELFARAFESYVEDKAENGGNLSPYLVFGTHEDPDSPWGTIYPHGRDREAINKAFTELFDTIETEERGDNVALFARRPNVPYVKEYNDTPADFNPNRPPDIYDEYEVPAKATRQERKEITARAKLFEKAEKDLATELLFEPRHTQAERLELEVRLQNATAMKLEEIREAIYSYAQRLRLPQEPFNRVERIIKNTKTTRGLATALSYMDKVIAQRKQRKVVLKVEQVFAREYKRISKLETARGKSGLDYRSNRRLKEYLDFYTSDTNVSREEVKRTMAWFHNNPESEMPDRVKRDIVNLFKQNIKSMPTMELVQVLRDIEEIKSRGYLKRRLEKVLEERNRRLTTSMITKEIGTDTRTAASRIKRDNESQISHLAKKYWWGNWSAERIIESLTNSFGKSSTLKSKIFEPIRKAALNKLETYPTTVKELKAIHAGINLADAMDQKALIEVTLISHQSDGTNKTEEIGINLDEAMFVYAHSQNSGGMNHLVPTYGEEGIKQIIKALPKEYKAVVDRMIDYFDTKMYPRLNAVFKRLHQVDLPKEPRYFPIQNLESNRAENALMTDLLARHGNRIGVKLGAIRSRSNAKNAFNRASYFKTIQKHIRDTEHYLSMIEAVNEARGWLENPEVKAAITNKSPEAYEALRSWLRDNSHGRIESPPDAMNQTFDWIRKNIVVSVFGFNPMVVAKQPLSLFPAIPYIGKVNAAKSLAAFARHPIKMIQFSKEKSSFMRTRTENIERELAEMAEHKKARVGIGDQTKWEKFKDYSVYSISAVDQMTATVVWNAAYWNKINDRKTEQEAIDHADYVTRNTQSTGDLVNMSGNYRAGGAVRMFSMFTSSLNKNANILYEIGKTWGIRDKKDNLERIFWMVVMSGMAEYMISHLKWNPVEMLKAFRDDPEGIVRSMAGQVLGGFPGIGDAIDAFLTKIRGISRTLRGTSPDKHPWDTDISTPTLDMMQEIVDTPGNVMDLVSGPNRGTAGIRIGRTAAKLTGFPMIISKIYQAVKDKKASRLLASKTATTDLSKEAYMAKILDKSNSSEEEDDKFAQWYGKLNDDEKRKFQQYVDEKRAKEAEKE